MLEGSATDGGSPSSAPVLIKMNLLYSSQEYAAVGCLRHQVPPSGFFCLPSHYLVRDTHRCTCHAGFVASKFPAAAALKHHSLQLVM